MNFETFTFHFFGPQRKKGKRKGKIKPAKSSTITIYLTFFFYQVTENIK